LNDGIDDKFVLLMDAEMMASPLGGDRGAIGIYEVLK
jgi:hypothetical protein